ncbi:hypothetical protein D3C73_1530240 [compost metagenome]
MSLPRNLYLAKAKPAKLQNSSAVTVMVVDSSRLFQVMMPNLRFTNSSVKLSQCSVVGIQIGGLMKISLISLSDELNSQNSGNRAKAI